VSRGCYGIIQETFAGICHPPITFFAKGAKKERTKKKLLFKKKAGF